MLPVPQQRFITIRNDTGADLAATDIVGLNEPVILPEDDLDAFKDDVTIAAIAPSISSHLSRFAVMVEPVESGQPGSAAIAGVVAVMVKCLCSIHQYARIASGVSYGLVSDFGGYPLVWIDGEDSDAEPKDGDHR